MRWTEEVPFNRRLGRAAAALRRSKKKSRRELAVAAGLLYWQVLAFELGFCEEAEPVFFSQLGFSLDAALDVAASRRPIRLRFPAELHAQISGASRGCRDQEGQDHL